MVDFYTEPGEDTPEIELDSAQGRFRIRGKSFPENAVTVFKPLIDKLEAVLPRLNGARLQVDFDLTYFNSSSAKALMRLAQILDDHAGEGVAVEVNWHYPSDDEALQEFGEDLAEDMAAATFRFAPYTHTR